MGSKFILADKNDVFKTRPGESIGDLDKYVEMLRENNYTVTDEDIERYLKSKETADKEK
ncbi:MAG: hypothetical protein RR620_08935 [Clostridium sp.]